MTTLTPSLARPAGTPAARRPSVQLRAWLGAASLAALVSGALHVLVAARHVEHGGAAVGFFLLAAAAQLGGGLWLAVHAVTGVRPGTPLVLAGVAGTVALVGVFVVAHGTDLLLAYVTQPLGHDTHTATHTGPFAAGVATRNDTLVGVRQDPGGLGTATVAAELAATVALTALLPGTLRGRVLNGLLVLCGCAWLLWATGVLA